MSQESNTPGPSGPPQFRPVPGKPGVDPLGKRDILSNVVKFQRFEKLRWYFCLLLCCSGDKCLKCFYSRTEDFTAHRGSIRNLNVHVQRWLFSVHWLCKLERLYQRWALVVGMGVSQLPSTDHHLDLISSCGQKCSARLTF